MQQQIDVTACLTLSLPTAWDRDKLNAYIAERLAEAFSGDYPGEAPRFAGNTKGLTGDVLSFALADPPKRQSTDREFVAARPGLAGAVHQEQTTEGTENGEGGVE
jgi:hypothetical protein